MDSTRGTPRTQRAAATPGGPGAAASAAAAAGEAVAAWRAAQHGVGTGELAYRRELSRFERLVGRLRTRVFASAVASVATVVAAFTGSPWWLCVTALALWYGGTGYLRLRRARPPQRSAYPTQWSPAFETGAATRGARRAAGGRGLDLLGGLLGRPPLPRDAVGAETAERLALAESHLTRVVPAVERLYPPAGAELARAVDEAAPLLHQQVERLAVLDGLSRDMAGSPPGDAATEAAVIVTERLRAGVAAYEGLLAAAAELLGAPDLGRSAHEALSPAVQGMKAYTHGLGTADGTADGIAHGPADGPADGPAGPGTATS